MNVQPRQGEIERKGSFPATLEISHPGRRGGASTTPILDGSSLSDKMIELLRRAQQGALHPNYDDLLYHEGNSKNWSKITSDPAYYAANEGGVITRTAKGSAAHADPNQSFGLASLGPGDKFYEKEGEVIRAFVEEGHKFTFFAYIDDNQTALDNSVTAGKKIAKELGIKRLKHIPILGGIYSKESYDQYKDALGDGSLLTTFFGLTAQNFTGPISGVTDAREELTKRLKFFKKILPKGGRFLATFDQNSNRESILEAYSGEAHDDFTFSAVAHHLGDAFADHSSISRGFIGNTNILRRDVVLNQDVGVMLSSGKELLLLKKGSTIWHGVSAKLSEKHVSESFENANFPLALQEPFRDGNKQISCFSAYKP